MKINTWIGINNTFVINVNSPGIICIRKDSTDVYYMVYWKHFDNFYFLPKLKDFINGLMA